MQEALGGGEDYELVIAVGRETWRVVGRLLASRVSGALSPSAPSEDASVRTLGAGRWSAMGWQHRLG